MNLIPGRYHTDFRFTAKDIEREKKLMNEQRPTVGPKGGTGTPPKQSFDAEREQIITDLRQDLKEKTDHVNTLILQNKALADRIAIQSELLSKKAEVTPIDQHEGKKYLRAIVGATDRVGYVEIDGKKYPVIEVDVYAVLDAFNVLSQPIGHAAKKLLACGVRGKGDVIDDLKGVLAAVNRAIQQEIVRQAPKEMFRCQEPGSSSTATTSAGEPTTPPADSPTESPSGSFVTSSTSVSNTDR